MSIQVLCPNCGDVSEWHRPPAAQCGRCHVDFPSAVREATERALDLQRAPKPTLLEVGQYGSAAVGCVLLLMLILSPFDVGNYSIDGASVSGTEFFRQTWLGLSVASAFCLSIAAGLWFNRAWVRPLMIAYWFSWPLGLLVLKDWTVRDLIGTALSSVVCAGLASLYLYGRPNVQAYFDARTPKPRARGAN
ncbi:MAG: hypothetical protein ACREN6_10395 [Gemmatimonadaceae bacterium]